MSHGNAEEDPILSSNQFPTGEANTLAVTIVSRFIGPEVKFCSYIQQEFDYRRFILMKSNKMLDS